MHQARAELKGLKEASRKGDVSATLQLLARSVALGHRRLSVRRFFAASVLGATNLAPYRRYCEEAMAEMTIDEVLATARAVVQRFNGTQADYSVLAELLPVRKPLILPFDSVLPNLKDPSRICGPNACLLGKVTIGADALLASSAVIRADGHYVRIGHRFVAGEGSTVHIAHDVSPTVIGNGVSIGRNTVVHACMLGNDCVVEDDAVILDDSVVGDGAVIGAGSVVFPRSKLDGGWLYAGFPAMPVRQLSEDERRERAVPIREAAAASVLSSKMPKIRADEGRQDVFVAGTAQLSGEVELRKGVGVLFGCVLDAGSNAIVIGENTNVQDNTRIRGGAKPVIVGADTTIGHNVEMEGCRIGARSLIGIGCRIAPGTIVDDDVLLAGGAQTTPGQQLDGGWLWGGRPARALFKLDGGKRKMMREIIGQYRSYGDAYQQSQRRYWARPA